MTNNYNLAVKLSVLRLLGPNLYSNIPAVLSEMIANAWDADATRVDIRLYAKKNEIEIEDNGLGMSESDLMEKYLSVGYEKRKKKVVRLTQLKRHVMGRKGIGKLAIFSFAEVAEIHTVSANGEAGCVLDWEKIEKRFEKSSYKPERLTPDRVKISNSTGTRIVMRGIQWDKLGSTNDESKLRMHLARRFTILDGKHDFDVYVNETKISEKDCTYFDAMEFIWYLGNDFEQPNLCKNLKHSPFSLPNELTLDNGTGISITGWVGTVDKPSAITLDGNNVISLYSFGKMVHEDILAGYNEIKARQFATYLIGEIEADFLDDDEQTDIVIANRQEVKSDDPRYIKLRDFILKNILQLIAARWTNIRNVMQISPGLMTEEGIQDWYDALKGKTQQEKASSILKRLSKVGLQDNEEIKFAKIISEHFDDLKNIRGLVTRDDQEFLAVLKSFAVVSDDEAKKERSSDSPAGSEQSTSSSTPTENPDGSEQGTVPSQQPTNMPSGNFSSQNPNNDSDVSLTFNLPEPLEPLSATFRRNTPPERERENLFHQIKTTLENSRIPNNLKEIAIGDLRDAYLSYIVGANKASIVMLGAVLEGIMISVVHDDVILSSIRNNQPNRIALLVNCGIANNNVELALVKRNMVSQKFGFEEYRQIVLELLKDEADVDKIKLEEIQTFRNVIHPLKNLRQESYKNIDSTRSLNLLSSMTILTRIILKILE